jgi:type VI secretion system protein ImpC
MNAAVLDAAKGAAAPAEGISLLDDIVAQSKVAASEAEHHRAKDLISELVKEVLKGTVVMSSNLSATLDARVAELDRLISAQLSAVMHAPEFQQLESTWTGLHYLCKHTSTGESMKIKVLNAPKKDLVRDFKTAIDFDQSALFKKVYEEEFGTFGGAPFGALLGDYQIGRQPEDLYFAEQMSHVAAAAHAPFISAASPELFGLESFTRRCSTPSNTPSGSPSASRRIRATSASRCRASSAACPTTRRTARSPKASTTSRTWTAPTTRSTCGSTPPTPSGHA